MRHFIFLMAFIATNVASADVQPEDIFGGILDIIQDQINKDKDKKPQPAWGPGVILKDLGNGRIALGRVTLDGQNAMDSFVLPKCNVSPNEPVSALRFRIDGSDAFVKRVRITYQNNDQENVDVNEVYENGTVSDWYQVDTGSRCVKSIVVRGEPYDNNFYYGDDDNQFGLGSIKGFHHLPGQSEHGHGPQFPPPGHPGWGGKPPVVIVHPQPTVLTFIGLKADSDNNGF